MRATKKSVSSDSLRRKDYSWEYRNHTSSVPEAAAKFENSIENFELFLMGRALSVENS